MARHRITFLPAERMFYIDDQDTILDAAMKAGIYINASCGGNGSCGKCRIRVVEGNVLSDRHSKINRSDYDQGFRLACRSRVHSDTVIEVPLESQIDRSALKGKSRKPLILAASNLGQTVRRWKADPSFFKVYVELPLPNVDDNLSDLGRLRRGLRNVLKKDGFPADLRVLRKLMNVVREGSWKVTATLAVMDNGCHVVNVEPGNRAQQNYSIVFDIGTTTVSGQILDLANCSRDICTLGEASDYNAQVRYGDDVISRIMYSRKKGGLERLQEAVVSTINGIIEELTEQSGIDGKHISHLVFAGNTTMTHLLLGLDPRYIMLEPYTPVSNTYPPVLAKDLGMHVGDHAYARFFPCVSSYVGGDIVAGVIGSGMARSERVTLYMDIGTNGEIVLGNRDWLVCASCSAGPAFEGGGIQCGMRATDGAIEQVRINPASYEPMIITVGKAKPKGICGSGLIDGAAELFSTGLLDQRGKFRRDGVTPRLRDGESGYEYVLVHKKDTQINRDIVITEVDLDNLIRAKAALYAGCRVLLDSVGLGFPDVEMVIIAGGFGHYVDLEQAQIIGLLPELPLERFLFVGNGSLLGARLYSFSKGFMEEAETISKMMTNIELSNSQKFMDEFVAACFLPHTDGESFQKTMKRVKEITPP